MSSNQEVSKLAPAQDWKELLLNWSFPCPACGQVGILRTERESWYMCRHCGYVFSVEQAPINQQREQGN
jgi:rubredoxin